MNETKTLRDDMAMSAPFCYPEQYKLDATSTDQQMEAEIRARYRYADIAIRVRAETMPKAPSKLPDRPRWAKWACRDENGEPKYCSHEPVLGGCMWYCPQPEARLALVYGDTSFIPTNWRESKVKL